MLISDNRSRSPLSALSIKEFDKPKKFFIAYANNSFAQSYLVLQHSLYIFKGAGSVYAKRIVPNYSIYPKT